MAVGGFLSALLAAAVVFVGLMAGWLAVTSITPKRILIY
jgi:hypothetical protein